MNDSPATCTSNEPCPSDEVCGFPEASGCGAAGTSFPAPEVVCEAYSPRCACDGSEIGRLHRLALGIREQAAPSYGSVLDGG